MSKNRSPVSTSSTVRIGEAARRVGLDPSLLYETVIELANEGMLTARCVNAAAGILINELGLPEYYFRNISKEGLTEVLRVLSTNMRAAEGRFFLGSESVHLQCSVDGGLQVLVATAQTQDYMEKVMGGDLLRKRWEYYFSKRHHYYTYIIKPGACRPVEEVTAGQSPFAFASERDRLSVPEETSQRYETFLNKHLHSVARVIDFSICASTDETRVMFHKNVAHAMLPVIRKLLADHNVRLNRVYGEPYRKADGQIASVCSFYVDGTLEQTIRDALAADLRSFLSLGEDVFADQYLDGTLSFREMLFAVNAGFFVHQFIYKDLDTDRQIMQSLDRKDLRDALAKRISDANRSEYLRNLITDNLRANPDLVREVFALFDSKFNPALVDRPSTEELAVAVEEFRKRLDSRFVDDFTALDIFRYMCLLVTHTYKTNFYKLDKRSFAFRLAPDVLDPIVFSDKVWGVFFVVGHYSLGTHMRAEDIARGGLRLLRVTPSNYENQLDEANLLNYALGPQAQRLKHKDIAEGGSKGVIVPTPAHAKDALNAVLDYSEGVLDLMLPCPEIVDYLGRNEMIFFGPDEGTAHVMDRVANRAGERGYRHWRTFTTGKEIGLPHDAYGLTTDKQVFALMGRGDKGTELQIEGQAVTTTLFPDEIYRHIGGRVASSGMTTTGVMATFRSLIARKGWEEKDLNLLMTGGPDGDLGANQIQCYQGKICLIVDGGAVLFDPEGLDKSELVRLAFNRHASPRLSSAAYPKDKLSSRGFMIERASSGPQTLPDGTSVKDGAYYHKTFLTDPRNRQYIEQANITAFVPCGGFKDTINFANVEGFLANFRELQLIVEGANVFFDATARAVIAKKTNVLQIKDSTANKGGVTSSSLGEVLTGFLLEDEYEKYLVHDLATKFRLARELLCIIMANADAETSMLLDLYDKGGDVPLFELSIRTSEQLLALQALLYEKLDLIVSDAGLVRRVIRSYVPDVLVEILGMDRIVTKLSTEELTPYRNAILTKKLAATALYQHAVHWDEFLQCLKSETARELRKLMPTSGAED